MKSSSLLLVLGGALALGWALHASNLSVDREADAPRALPEPAPADAPAPLISASGEEDDSSGAILASLKHDIAVLKADLAGLRRLVKEQARRPRRSSRREGEVASPDPATLPLDPSVDRAESENAATEDTERNQAERIDTIEANLRGERLDATWAAQASDAIKHAIADEALIGTSVQDVECRATLCRVEVVHDNLPAAQFVQLFAMKVGPVLPRMTSQPVQKDDGTSGTLIYLAREGHDFPPLER